MSSSERQNGRYLWPAPLDEQPAQAAQRQNRAVPLYPNPSRLHSIPFYSPVEPNRELRPFMRAGSPIDRQPGVYLIFDRERRAYYVGSSVGKSRQGNVRRTILRHWQQWRRPKPLSQYVTKFRHNAPLRPQDDGGITMDRARALVAVFLLPAPDSALGKRLAKDAGSSHPARYLEQWIFEALCNRRRCVGAHAVSRDFPDVPF